MAEDYSHRIVSLQLNETKPIKCKLSLQPEENLNIIQKKIANKFKLNSAQYTLKVNDVSITDAEQFSQLLSKTAPPLTLHIVKNTVKKSTNNESCFTLKVYHTNNEFKKFPFPLSQTLWNEDVFCNLINDIKRAFNIKSTIELYEDEDHELEICDISDLKVSFQTIKLNSDFVYDLHVLSTTNGGDDDDDIKVALNPTDDALLERQPVCASLTATQHGALIDIQSKKDGDKIQKHRLYFLGPSGSHNISILFPELSAEFYPMTVLFEDKLKNLTYVDVNIPWNTSQRNAFQVGFKWQWQRAKRGDMMMAIAKQELKFDQTGFYYIENTKNVTTQRDADFAVVVKTKKKFGANEMIKKASKYILRHLCNQSKDYKSWKYSTLVLQDILDALKAFDKNIIEPMLNHHIESLPTHEIVTALRIMLIKMVKTKRSSLDLNLNQMYHITQCYVMDKTADRLLLLSAKKQRMLSWWSLHIFENDINKIMKDKKTPAHAVALIYPIYNLFKYFEQLLTKPSQSLIIFENNHKNEYYSNDKKCAHIDLLSILNVDLTIGTLGNYKRRLPFEVLAVRMCWLMYAKYRKQEHMNTFLKIFEDIASYKVLNKFHFVDLFNHVIATNAIFGLLSNRFNYWRQLIQYLTIPFILGEKYILNLFRSNLIGEIQHMQSDHATVLLVCRLIVGLSQLFDTINIRIALLTNPRFIKTISEHDKFTICTNMEHIMKVVTAQALLSETRLLTQIETFLVTCLSDYYWKRNQVFKIFNVYKYKYDDTKTKCFKNALNRVISQKRKVADRLIIFMCCAEFYSLDSDIVHKEFMDEVLKGTHPKIQTWDENQRDSIKHYVREFAQQEMHGRHLWNKIFTKTIILPSKESKFINKLNYCLWSLHWVKFAIEMHHIQQLHTFTAFCKQQLDTLNKKLTQKTLQIECIQLIYKQLEEMDLFVTDCGYKTKFKRDILMGMIDKYLQWDKIRECLNTFLLQYTSKQDAVVKETAEMVEFLKQWNQQDFKTVNVRDEWQQLDAQHETLIFIGDTESSVFRKMWYFSKESLTAFYHQPFNGTFADYFETVYPQVKDDWDDVIQKAKDHKLTIYDTKWFELDTIEEEIEKCFYSSDKVKFQSKKGKQLKTDISDALNLLEIQSFVTALQQIVKLFKENQIEIELEDHHSWATFESCVIATNKVNDESTVKYAGKVYRKLREILEIKDNDNYTLQQEWVRTTLECRKSVQQILNDNEFKKQYFIETLQLLDESNNGELNELSSSLRSVQKQWSNILEQSFQTETELMRHFATLNITEKDINNIKQVHNALPRIKQIVIDCGKMAQVRDKEKLDAAMNDKESYFQFKSQEEMRELIEKYNYNKSIDEIARYGFVLQYNAKDKIERYSVDEIENMMDVILLCKTNDIETYVRKLGICKEISELRVQYMTKGGRIKHQKMAKYQTIKACLPIKSESESNEHSLEGIRDECNRIMTKWTAMIKQKRIDHHIFNYFTINTLRGIIDKLNKFIRNQYDTHHIKLSPDIIAHFKSINKKQTKDDMKQCIAENKLCQEILCHFRFIKPEITESELKQHMSIWRYIDSAHDKAFDDFNKCFNTNRIVNEYDIQYNDISSYIHYGIPNLMIKKDKKDAIFASLKLFIKNVNEKSLNIPPYQYLICNEMTVTEDVQIFINRCTQNQYRHHSIYGYPLYCLMFPEDLNLSVLDQIADLFSDRLMTSDQQTKHYAFVVISCNDTNPLSNLLQSFKIKTNVNANRKRRTRYSEPNISLSTSTPTRSQYYKPRLLSDDRTAASRSTFVVPSTAGNINAFTRNDGAQICNALFNTSDNVFKSNKLFVKLYTSTTFGAGKSFMIHKQAMEINGKDAHIIRIPFNSTNIDLDFVVERLYKCYDGRRRNKVIYHLDISSSASNTVNSVLFNILFLKYISTPKNQCFSISTNMCFLIEIPADLSSLTAIIRNKVQNEFYLLHRPMRFNEEIINNETNPFQYDEHSRYAAKFLSYFYTDKLKTEDPDPDADPRKISDTVIRQLLAKYLPNVLRLSNIHQKSFWDYLHCQFRQVVSSHLLRNEFQTKSKGIGKLFSKGNFSEWKHITAESIIELAQDFATTNYRAEQETQLMQKNFHLTEKWQKVKKEIVLLNQSIDGSISFLVSDKNAMDKVRKEALEKGKFDLLCWKQSQNDEKSKREKLKLLLKIIGNPLDDERLRKGDDIEYFSKKNNVNAWIKGKITKRTVSIKGDNINTKIHAAKIHVKLEDDRDDKIIEEKHWKERIRAYCAVLSESPYCDYALTYDNMLKMIAIFFRVKSRIPVILMGETGCGKTFLLDYLAKAANIEIETVNVHGGFTAKDIRERMRKWVNRAEKKLRHKTQKLLQMQEPYYESKNDYVLISQTQKEIFISREDVLKDMEAKHELQTDDDLWIFFDEINTSSDIGFFKEILCDKSFEGESLPPNMKIIGACNPNTERKMDDITDKSLIADPLARYVYRVYPLPQTMLSYVWIFGSLQMFEKEYIIEMTRSMVQKLNRKLKNKEQRRLETGITYSQTIIRRLLHDSGMYVSLRDIARCLKVFKWEFNRMGGNFNYSLWKALAITYYYRLDDRKRAIYAKVLVQYNDISLSNLSKQFYDDFEKLFQLRLPGIAWNQTLKENLFLLLTCIQTKIPCILVGKPGSSKTLALSIIRDFLSSTSTTNEEILQHHDLKPIYILSFQCSAHSTAEDIKKKWKQTVALANTEHALNHDTIYVLLLDEIGLAEHSENRPLKILHQLLEIEPAPISFVGLSNWQLDAAKMNRVVMHQCYIHKKTDLIDTARAMAAQFYTKPEIDRMEARLDAICGIYCDLMDTNNKLQPRKDFFGARDYYGVIRHFLGRDAANSAREDIVMHFLRNFGGINHKTNGKYAVKEPKRKSFTDIMKDRLSLDNAKIIQNLKCDFNPATLIAMNLGDQRLNDVGKQNVFCCDNFSLSRHIMIITEFTNSWNVLLDLRILSYDNVFIFGSEFERDKSNIYLYLNHVKNCMETGQTLILIHLEEIHESLYDMLNQRYVFRKTDNKMYCRIALGSKSQTCFVDPSFKCIVVSSKANAHSDNGTPIAFLNRFEKQLVSYYNSLYSDQFRLLYKLQFDLFSMYQCHDDHHFPDIFPGYCRDTLPSIVINVWNHFDRYREHNVLDIDFKQDSRILINECIKILFSLNSTEFLVRAASAKRFKEIQFDTVCTLKGIIEMDDIYIYDELTAHNPTDDPMDDAYDDLTDDDLNETMIVTKDQHESKTFRDIMDIDYRLKTFCDWCQEEEYDSDAIHQDTDEAATLSNIYHVFQSNFRNIKQNLFNYDEHDKSRLIVALTYDFEFNLQRNASYLHKTKIKRMDDFGKVHYFEEFIDEFLRYDTSFHHLLLHYKHKKDRANHFIHIKHIILTLINKHKNSSCINKQIILMVHLQRKQDLYLEFPLMHCNAYKIMYLDSLSQQIPMHMSIFIKQKVSEICKERGLQLLHDVFPRALSCLHFEKGIRPIDIQGEIQRFCKILSQNCELSQRLIRKTISKRFVKLLSNPKIDANISEIVCNAIKQSFSWNKGSFYDRLKDVMNKFAICAMAHVLKLLYTNHNIQTITKRKDPEMLKVFISLYCSQNGIFTEDTSINLDVDQILQGKRSLQVRCKYRARFPFSNILSEWLNAKKAMIVDKEQDLKEDEYDDDDENDDLYDIDKKTDIVQSDVKQLFHRYQVVINNELNKLPLDTLSYAMLELYAQDMMHIYAESLGIDPKTSLITLRLSAKVLMLITSLTKDSDCMTIADLECAMWTHTEFMIYMIRIFRMLDDDKLNEIDIDYKSNKQKKIESLMDKLKVIFKYVHKCLNETQVKYHLYSKLALNSAISYVIHFIEGNYNINCQPLIESFNCIKIQWIVAKHNLNPMLDPDALSDLMERQSLLLSYNVLKQCVDMLATLITKRIALDKTTRNILCNRVLYDLLNLVDNDYIRLRCNDDERNNFYQFLVDLLCEADKIIAANRMTLVKKMRYKLLIKLFGLFPVAPNKLNQMVTQMQTKHDKFAKVIIEIMASQSRKYAINMNEIQFTDCSMFHCTYSIQTPLIASIHTQLYRSCINKVTLASFFVFIQRSGANKGKYPVLYRLSEANEAFWYIQSLPAILKWMSMLHSKYNVTLSQKSCDELNIDDVRNAAKYNKWGHFDEWTKKWNIFRSKWNELNQTGINKHKLAREYKDNAIYSSLIGNGNKVLRDNRNCIQTLIDAHNDFLYETPSVNMNVFDIKAQHLVNCDIILDIIRKHAEIRVCYDTHYEKECKTYLIFDVYRVEEEIYNKCIAGRSRIKVEMSNFEFIGSNHMLKWIRKLKYQETISYEMWHAFDKQFETNIQRKRALHVVEDVIPLWISTQNNYYQHQMDEKYDDDNDEDSAMMKLKMNMNLTYAQKPLLQPLMNENNGNNQILWKFMESNLRFYILSNEYLYFKFDGIKVKHLQSLWNKLIHRIEDKMKQYADQCIICRESISLDTPIELECCTLNLHYNCLKEYINNTFIRNNGQKVTLKQLSCLICRKQMRNEQIPQLFEPINELYDKVTKIALARLIYDKREKDAAIVDGGDTQIAYAMKLYSIFVCFKCKNPYYGGMNNCFDDMETDDDDHDFAEERLCNRCLPITMNPKQCNIASHGDQYIQWKCRYCCSYATFFCWGTHHFCEMCHWKAYTLKNKGTSDLVQCPCKPNPNTKLPESIHGDCPLGIDIAIKHPPSGQEYCLGCALCKKP